jgi:hypothetical protein
LDDTTERIIQLRAMDEELAATLLRVAALRDRVRCRLTHPHSAACRGCAPAATPIAV